MLNKCKNCVADVGYFKLMDGLCEQCISNNAPSPKASSYRRMYKKMPVMIWILIALVTIQAIIFPIFAGYLANHDTLSFLASAYQGLDVWQIIFFHGLLVLLYLLPLILHYIIRFVIIRRRIHIALSLLIVITLYSFPVGLMTTINSTGHPSYISVLFMVIAFRILRVPNIEITQKITVGNDTASAGNFPLI